MIRPLRTAHRWVFVVMAVVVAALLVAALARPRGPIIMDTPPLGPHTAAPPGSPPPLADSTAGPEEGEDSLPGEAR